MKLQKKELLDSLKEIHQSSIIPFLLFNKKKTVIYINDAFLRHFNFIDKSSLINKEINFLFLKEEKDLIPFSALSIERIANPL